MGIGTLTPVIVEMGIFIGGIIWGVSLLNSELQSPGSVSLSAAILYVFLFYSVGEYTSHILKAVLNLFLEFNS